MRTSFAAKAISAQFESQVPGSMAISVLAVWNQSSLCRQISDASWEQSRLYPTEFIPVIRFQLSQARPRRVHRVVVLDTATPMNTAEAIPGCNVRYTERFAPR
jgi:hypothetical protein